MDGVLIATPTTLTLNTAPSIDRQEKTTSSGTTTVVGPQQRRPNPDGTMLVLEEDVVLALGAYEVEIVACVGTANNCKDTNVCPSTTSSSSSSSSSRILKRPLITNRLGKHGLLSKKRAVVRKPLHSTANTTNSTTTSITSSNVAISNEQSAFTISAAKQKSTNSASSIQNGSTNPLRTMQSRTFVPRRTFKGIHSSLHPKRNSTLGGVTERHCNSRHTPTNSMTHHHLHTKFPGAIGTIDLPHSIQNALKEHQRVGLIFLWNCLQTGGAILADEMGLGKTLMTIAAICALHRQQRDKKYIVVCPSSLVSNWAKEFDKWIGTASQPKRMVVSKGGADALKQIKVFASSSNHHQVLILSYDIFRRHVEHLQRCPSRILVVDEGHRLKNTSGSLTLTALESLDTQSRLLLTATPIQNVLSDFFTIANFTNPGILGDLTSFRRDFERPISAANHKNCTAIVRQKGLEQSRKLEEITQTFMLRRLQKDVLKSMLPPRTEVLLFCRPSPEQATIYQQVSSQSHEDPLATLTKLRKVCLHPNLVTKASLDASPPITNLQESGKLSLLDQLLMKIRISAPADKVVVVSNFTSALGLIADSILKPRGYTFVRLDGSTELSNRQGIVDTFNKTSSERSFVFLLSSKAGGCGLNLVGANRLIMADSDWNPASDIQAMARVYRQGQEKPCTIYRLFLSGTVEEVICQRQIQKCNLASHAVDSHKGGEHQGFRKEELKDCFTLKSKVACDTKVKMGSRWPEYEGCDSLIAQGCDDEPLLQVASSSKELNFVHVVQEYDPTTTELEDGGPEGENLNETILSICQESKTNEREIDTLAPSKSIRSTRKTQQKDREKYIESSSEEEEWDENIDFGFPVSSTGVVQYPASSDDDHSE